MCITMVLCRKSPCKSSIAVQSLVPLYPMATRVRVYLVWRGELEWRTKGFTPITGSTVLPWKFEQRPKSLDSLLIFLFVCLS